MVHLFHSLALCVPEGIAPTLKTTKKRKKKTLVKHTRCERSSFDNVARPLSYEILVVRVAHCRNPHVDNELRVGNKAPRRESTRDSEYGVNTRRMTAWGYASSAPFPWQGLLAQLSDAAPDTQDAGEKRRADVAQRLSVSTSFVNVAHWVYV